MLAKVGMTERQRADVGKDRYDRQAAQRCWQRQIRQRGSAKVLAKVGRTERQHEGAGKGRYDSEAARRCWQR